jgi:hypothetical protein
MNKYICISLFIVGIMGFYSVAFAEDCNLTVKCVCESNSLRIVPCPMGFSNAAIDCTKEGIPQGTCTVDCGPEIAASCQEIPIECRNNETKNCLVTLPVEVSQSQPPAPTCGDGVLDTGEECDGTQLGSFTCQDFACTGGTLACTASCTRDLSGCTGCGPISCNSDAQCSSGQYCDQDEDMDGVRECVTKKNNGISCAENNECASDNCVDGYCCNTPCGDECDSCNNSGSEGSCTLNLAGSQGNPSCSPYLCNGTSATCPNTCTTVADCISLHDCVSGSCVP